MKDEKSRDFMNQYMFPNSRDKGIERISKVIIKGEYTHNDFDMLKNVFGNFIKNEDRRLISIELPTKQIIEFTLDKTYHIDLYTNSTTGKFVEIENVKIYC